uniref:Uncharacterized protein n=1 Tax=Quercus lobata TaxID=97700 RepID=A0A7N2KR31_QUELO
MTIEGYLRLLSRHPVGTEDHQDIIDVLTAVQAIGRVQPRDPEVLNEEAATPAAAATQRPSTTESPSTSIAPTRRLRVRTPRVVPTSDPPPPTPHPSLSPTIPSPTLHPSRSPTIPPLTPHPCVGPDIRPPTPRSFPDVSPIPSFDLGIHLTPPDIQQEPPSSSMSTGPSSAITPPHVHVEEASGLPVQQEGRPKRISKAPPCGTGGHKHGHNAGPEASDEGHARPPPYYTRRHKVQKRGSTSNNEKLNNSVKFWRKVQALLKLGDLRSAQSNFDKVLEIYPDNCETLKALGHIYVQLGQTEKAQEFMRKATKIDPRDSQAFFELGELLISSDTGAALDAFKTARSLLKKGGQEVPIELLNNIGVHHFERGEFELAEQSFKEALGDGVWLPFIEGSDKFQEIDASASVLQYKDRQLFHRLEDSGRHVELPWNKVTPLFNLARLQEQLHNAETASILYRLILYKYPDYVDAYLRLAAIAKARNNVQLSIELVVNLRGQYRFNSKYTPYILVGQQASLVLVQLQVLQEFLPVLIAKVLIISTSNLRSSPTKTLETSPQEQQHIDSDNYSLDCDGSFLDGFSDVDSWSDNEEITNTVFDEDNKLSSLMSMGYTRDEASIAMERCDVSLSSPHPNYDP